MPGFQDANAQKRPIGKATLGFSLRIICAKLSGHTQICIRRGEKVAYSFTAMLKFKGEGGGRPLV